MDKSKHAIQWIRYDIATWSNLTAPLSNEHIGALYRIAHHSASGLPVPADKHALSFITRLDLESLDDFLNMVSFYNLGSIDPDDSEYMRFHLIDFCVADAQSVKEEAVENGKKGGYHKHKARRDKLKENTPAKQSSVKRAKQ